MIKKQMLTDRTINLESYNAMIDAILRILSMRFDQKYFCVSNGRVTMVQRDYGFPWGSKWVFGLAINGSLVTIYDGEFQLGENDFIDVASATVSVTEDYSKVGLRYDIAAQSCTIVNFGTTPLANDTSVYERWFYSFRYSEADDYVTLYKVNSLGIQIAALYGDKE